MNGTAYDRAITEFVQLLAAQGFDHNEVRTIQHEIDCELCEAYGFGTLDRFAASFERTYDILCPADVQDEDVLEEIERLGWSVFHEVDYVALPGALETLNHLYPHYNIAVVTKGNPEEQRRKARHSGVMRFTDAFFPVDYKNEEDWHRIIQTLGIPDRGDMEKTWCIGNSVRSDVNVPLSMGMNAIHVDSHTWGFENRGYEDPWPDRTLWVVDDIRKVQNFVPLRASIG